MNTKHLFLVLAVLLGALASGQGQAQTIFSEDFTGTGTTNQWYFFNGACLTAGTSTSTASPGNIPGCQTVWSNYYSTTPDKDPYLFGGNSGFLGSSTAPSSGSSQKPDPVGSGALRFSNAGSGSGNQERGAIISATPTPTGQGIQVTFKTVTYGGDSGGTGKDGADGISFFLMDPSRVPITTTGATGVPTAVGATGGSLGYSCSNSNGPPQGVTYDGLTGGYIGLGIDEFGNFLNGTTNLTTNATSVADNTATGYGFTPGRIGLRGAGSISWQALNAAYGTNQGSSLPYYPESLTTTFGTFSCGGLGSNNNQFCYTCPSATSFPGAPANATGVVTTSQTTCTDTLYNSVSTCPAAASSSSYGAPSTPVGTISFNGRNCIDTVTITTTHNGRQTNTPTPFTGPSTAVFTTTPTTTAFTVTMGGTTTLAESAVQQTCSTGMLYNFNTPAAPVAVTTATLTTSSGAANTANPAGILDYAAIPNAFQNITAFTIANESATTRSQATPIFYNLKITQNGLLSLSYSTGGAFSSIIQNQNITNSNGPLPPSFLFGFSGSTGGDTNIHEIMCFKAAAATTSGSSATVNQVQSAKVEAGSQAFFAFYNPNVWTGTVTANGLADNNGVITVNTQANWDAQCMLTGTSSAALSAGGGCASTLASGPTSANPAPTSRVMLTWDTSNNVGIPFEWASLNQNQQTALDDENGTPDIPANTQFRLNYLRGDRSNEITGSGTGMYRAREGILGDIVDSSPSWVGPPSLPYSAAWSDRLNPATVMPENSGSPNNTQTYLQFITAEQGRLNVVYAGANDGLLHGFEAGSFDTSGNFCGTTGALITCASTPNDGKEVIAYMPGSTIYSAALSSTTGGCAGSNVSTGTAVQNIHGWTPAIGTGTSAVSCETPGLDYSATPYGHNFFVDATPGTGDLFFNGAWHTWLVGGLGAGGAAIYALDITDPTASGTAFSESNAKNIVMGEWNSGALTCTIGTTVVTTCGKHLGNTYGTPQIRRLHNGNWAAIFGNGFSSASGDAGIYIMLIDNPTTTSNPASTTFYYLSANPSGSSSNAIFSGTGSQSGTVVTISAVASVTGASGKAATGAIAVGDVLTGPGVIHGSTVLSFGTGTGGTGTYNVSTSGTVNSGAVTVGNGIAYTTPVDLDGDHITDYVYAGDLQGNMWRFDLTSANPSQWGVTNSGGASIDKPTGTAAGQGGGGSPAPLFTAISSGGQIQRITTQPLAVSNVVPGAGKVLMVEFGTGQRTQITNATSESFLSGTQALYGVWDWNLSAWNALSPSSQYATVASSATGLASPFALGFANLTAQTLTPLTNGTVNGTNATVCWAGTTTCTTGNTSFGWYATLPGSSEQIIFNPVFFQGSMLVNSTIPAVNTATSCTISTDTGFTYALNVANGGVFNNAFPTFTFTNPTTNISTVVSNPTAAGVETNATGSVYVVNTVEGKANIVFQTVLGTPGSQQVIIPSNTLAKRLTWVERR
jgi:type IV pilus assembly protein PilY1